MYFFTADAPLSVLYWIWRRTCGEGKFSWRRRNINFMQECREHIGSMQNRLLVTWKLRTKRFRRELKEVAHFLIFREMRCFFFNSRRNLFVLNFQVTSRRFYIDPICSLHSHMKFMFHLRHENSPSPHVLLHIQYSADRGASAVSSKKNT